MSSLEVPVQILVSGIEQRLIARHDAPGGFEPAHSLEERPQQHVHGIPAERDRSYCLAAKRNAAYLLVHNIV